MPYGARGYWGGVFIPWSTVSCTDAYVAWNYFPITIASCGIEASATSWSPEYGIAPLCGAYSSLLSDGQPKNLQSDLPMWLTWLQTRQPLYSYSEDSPELDKARARGKVPQVLTQINFSIKPTVYYNLVYLITSVAYDIVT